MNADQPTNLGEILWRWPGVEPITPYFPGEDACEATIPISKLSALLKTLAVLEKKCERIKKLVFYVQPEVRKVRIQDTPPEFFLTYHWAVGKLSLAYPEGVVELPDGWYRQGDVYWYYPTLSVIDQGRIRRETIEKGELLEFLQRDLSAYAGAGVRYACELHFDTIPVLKGKIRPSSYERYQFCLQLLCKDQLAHMDVRVIRQEDVQMYINRLDAMSASTVKKQKLLLGQVFEHAMLTDVIQRSPVQGTQMPPQSHNTKVVYPYERDEQEKLVAAFTEENIGRLRLGMRSDS